MKPDEQLGELEAFLYRSKVNLHQGGPVKTRFINKVMARVRAIIAAPAMAPALAPEPNRDLDTGRIEKYEVTAAFAKGPAVVMTPDMSSHVDDQIKGLKQ